MSFTQTYTLLPVPSAALVIPPSSTNGSPSIQPIQFSLIIPTYNESRNIGAIVQQLTDLLNQKFSKNYELIVVDDNSPDQTWKIALDLIPHYPQLRVMRRQQERGLSTAVIRGWQAAEGEILGVIDGDLQHPPELLLKLLSAITDQQADLAVASRHVEGGGVSDWSPARRFLSRGAQVLGLLILPNVVGRVSDPMSGYFLVRRDAIASSLLSPVGYKILLEVIGRGTIQKVAEVGYVFQERQEGESKVTWKQYLEYLMHLFSLRLRSNSASPPARQLALKRFIQFGLVGLSGVFIDMAVFYLLSDPSALGWGLTRSKILAAEVAVTNNFLWNDFWTFRDISSQQRGWRKRFRRFVKFNLICLAGIILNVLIMNLLFNVFGVNRYIANLLAIVMVTLWNFWLNLKLSWRVTDTQK
jgi:dolichol-phosphate mannosyltransferase